MGSTSLFVFLDTNVLIHALPVEQIPWTDYFKVEQVVLVLTTDVSREIDKLKDGSDGKLSRERAREFSAALNRHPLSSLRAGAPIRPGVTLRILTKEPQLYPGADPEVVDDRIVSSVLGFDTEGADSVLCSFDLGIRLKADAHGIRAEELPTHYKRRAEADPLEKENKDLQRRLAAQKAPKFKVGFVRDGVPLDGRVPVRLQAPRATDPNFIHMDAVREAQDEMRDVDYENFGEFRGQRDERLVEIEERLHAEEVERLLEARTLRFSCVVENLGTAPGTNMNLSVAVDEPLRVESPGLSGGALQHGSSVSIDVAVVMPTGFQGRGFTLNHRLACDELPEADRDSHNFRIEWSG